MPGANYMGGKRNAARVKSKDIVGRAQRRHFGKQRLASALQCVAQGNRVHGNTQVLSSLPEITLAHAHRSDTQYSGVTSGEASLGDGLSSSRLPSNKALRKKPSKILGALDTSDHISMRAAVDRILQQPTLVGIIARKLREVEPVENTQSPIPVVRSTQTCLISKDSDSHYSETFSGPQPDMRYWSPVDAQSDSPGIHGTPSQRGMDNTQTRFLTRDYPFLHEEDSRPDRHLDAVYPLPRSSPFTSSPRSTDNSFLNLDTSSLASMPFGRPINQSEDNYMDTYPCLIPRTPFCPLSQSLFIHEGLTDVDGAQSTILSFTNSDAEELEIAWSSCSNDSLTFLPTADSEFRVPFPSEYGHNTEDGVPGGTSIDFLSDPHPWETIGRILKLEPPGSFATQFSAIGFKSNREGVGYVAYQKSNTCDACFLDATSFETRIGDKSEDDMYIASTTTLCVPPIVEAENIIGAIELDAAKSPCANYSSLPLLDQGYSSASPVDVTMLHTTSSIPVACCVQSGITQSSLHPTIAVGTTVTGAEVDTMFAGPCLFGDSDMEDDG